MSIMKFWAPNPYRSNIYWPAIFTDNTQKDENHYLNLTFLGQPTKSVFSKDKADVILMQCLAWTIHERFLTTQHIPDEHITAFSEAISEADKISRSLGKESAAAYEIISIPVICNKINGIYLVNDQRIICDCEECKMKENKEDRVFLPTHFEQHCGAGTAKKWRGSVKIRPGYLKEVPSGCHPMSIGKWFNMVGMNIQMKRLRGKTKQTNKRDISGMIKLRDRQDTMITTTFNDEILMPDKKAPRITFTYTKSIPPKPELWKKYIDKPFKPIKVVFFSDRCAVCDGDVDYDVDQFLTCDKCGITVHPTCYGVDENPSHDVNWLCRACETNNTDARCCLCPIAGGALKPTDLEGGNYWCHVACMQWIPETTAGDTVKMEPVTRIKEIPKDRWELNCCICKQKMGAKIQCSKCCSAYHPLCGRLSGCYMEMRENKTNPNGPMDCVSFCPQHFQPFPLVSGMKRVIEDGRFSNIKLYNSQPYPCPPKYTISNKTPNLPSLNNICSRTQDLTKLKKVLHGLGVGSCTIDGFWLSKEPIENKNDVHNTKSKDINIVENVDLIKMPSNAPEQITIECNGNEGIFCMRSQQVLYKDKRYLPKDFLMLCKDLNETIVDWKHNIYCFDKNEKITLKTLFENYQLDGNELFNLRLNYFGFYHSCPIVPEAEGIVSRNTIDYNESNEEKIRYLINQCTYDDKEIESDDDESFEDCIELTSTDFNEIESDEEIFATTKSQKMDVVKEDGLNIRTNNIFKNEGQYLIGKRLGIWWKLDKQYYYAQILNFNKNTGKHYVLYDDDQEEWLDLGQEKIEWEKEEDQRFPWMTTPRKSMIKEEIIKVKKIDEEFEIQTTVPIICNGMLGEFLVSTLMVRSKNGKIMKPRDFECAAGKGSSKKWRASIRVREPDGTSAINIGTWLQERNIDSGCRKTIPKRIKTVNINTNVQLRKRKKSSQHGMDVVRRTGTRHQIGCQCNVCIKKFKAQTSRRHRTRNGIITISEKDNDDDTVWRPATTLSLLKTKGPYIRYGKLAYIEAMPNCGNGINRFDAKEIPKSYFWTTENWYMRKEILIKEEDEMPSIFYGESKLTKQDKWRLILKQCAENEEKQMCFGKSGIHGWGLFAKVDIPRDTMITEYRGEIINQYMAELREEFYKKSGLDCYLFHFEDGTFIDATMKGGIGRFTNHSCAPSLYTKFIYLDGKCHLCFFARYDIKRGQELTYDYRFEVEDEEEKIKCQCGAPVCHGYLN